MSKKVNDILSARLSQKTKSNKMASLANETARGKLTTFGGVFSISDLSQKEKENIKEILLDYSTGKENLDKDLTDLISLTSEVKAITNQAAILHGERIKRAQILLKNYKEGAFSAWLLATYGNRQTPYNFLQYYEFYKALPNSLRPQLEAMPRQAIYTLATRNASIEEKKKIVKSYKGQTKAELLSLIRKKFPLAEYDRRRQDQGLVVINQLQKLYNLVKTQKKAFSKAQTNKINLYLKKIREEIK